MKSIIYTAIFAIVGSIYAERYASPDYMELKIAIICILLPIAIMLVALAIHWFHDFMADGFREAERRMKS
jgi:hypothetical protein